MEREVTGWLNEGSRAEITMLNEMTLGELREVEDYAHFRAGIVEYTPESFMPEQMKEILDNMIQSKVIMEDRMREHFATLTEAEQTMLLDSLGESGYRDRDWWYRMLMDGPVHRDRPTI